MNNSERITAKLIEIHEFKVLKSKEMILKIMNSQPYKDLIFEIEIEMIKKNYAKVILSKKLTSEFEQALRFDGFDVYNEVSGVAIYIP